VYDYVLAIISVDAAHDALALGQVEHQGSLEGAPRLTELAEAYRRAAEANVDTLEVLVEVEDAAVAGEGKAWIATRVARSREITLAELGGRSALQRWLLDAVGLAIARAADWVRRVLSLR
jgi:hypothetical protein